MARLEDLIKGALVKGVLPDTPVTVVDVQWHGDAVVTLTYKDTAGRLGNELIYRDREPLLEIVSGAALPWSFDGDGALFRLVSEATRIRLAYLFDPRLAVHTSLIEPLPHQITAVYGEMLARQPLRFLLADDPGAGKTIMTGLFIKELLLRGDLRRCLIVCPGSLVEQWQDELDQRFHLPFEILTTDRLESARTGNAFAEVSLALCRLDKLARDEDLQAKLALTDWDLIVVDEAHKLSATFFGGEVKYTKRYRLGQLLSRLTRHFLLLTATPHNGKEEDFQLFMALLDDDRFEGRPRGDEEQVDASDMMRRLVKEQLLKFDGKPLFPERIAYPVNYSLSPLEADLYRQVTNYVREEFNRADALGNNGRKGTVGFALTTLQRRLASSPEAIYQSLRRRRERLEKRLREEQTLRRGAEAHIELLQGLPALDEDALDDLDEAPDAEVESLEDVVTDQASAARTIAELQAEIRILANLEALALRVRRGGTDRKWEELAALLQDNAEMFDTTGARRKLVIFTEHRDTLNYLTERISTLLGQPEAVVVIHGALQREARRAAQERFLNHPAAQVLVATDAAGEGVNLQRAHLMVNYDLPWNPNRLEQRFGRIHRIGQTEVCHLWNLIASETREGEVFQLLFEKLEEERKALGGQVFDVLGKLRFENQPLRDLVVQAIRYGDQPEVRERLTRAMENGLERARLRELLDERALAHETLDVAAVQDIREDMERAEARRLQPHFIADFFLEAFKLLGGSVRARESGRYQITHVPASIRNRDRQIGTGQRVLTEYERVTFEKALIALPGKPLAAFICPGHPLLDATIDLILERYRHLLKHGAILVDPTDPGDEPRALVYLEHAIQDAQTDPHGGRRTVSRQMQFVELDAQGNAHPAGYAPYLDYRPLTGEELLLSEKLIAAAHAQGYDDLEASALTYAITQLVPQHLDDVRQRREALVDKTKRAVHQRLTREINYWDHRASTLRLQEQAGRTPALNSELAARRADELQARLRKRLEELEQERQLSAQPPVVVGGALIMPAGLLAQLRGKAADPTRDERARETRRIELAAMAAVMRRERELGYVPRDVSAEKCGYDIESQVPGTGKLRFIEVKGRVKGAETVTLTKNEILTGLNTPDDFILALVEVSGEVAAVPRYVARPFMREPDFGATGVIYSLGELLARGEGPLPNPSPN